MVKKIKFPLEMKNGVKVRSLEELKENFDLEKILSYFLDGRLFNWLNDRYYEIEAEKISNLNTNSTNLKKQICDIFEVDFIEDDLKLEELEYKNERIRHLKQHTDNDEIINNIDYVAFNQEELSDLLDRNSQIIYLCGSKFNIPLSKENVKYVGINTPIVIINSNVLIDWESRKIYLENVKYDDRYLKLIQENVTKNTVDANTNSMVIIKPYDSEFWYKRDDILLVEYKNKQYVYNQRKIYVIDLNNNERSAIKDLNQYNFQKIIAYNKYIIYIYMVGNNCGDHLNMYSLEDDYSFEIDRFVYDFTIYGNKIYYEKSSDYLAWSNRQIKRYDLSGREHMIIKDFGEIRDSIFDLKCNGKKLFYKRKTSGIMGTCETGIGQFIELE